MLRHFIYLFLLLSINVCIAQNHSKTLYISTGQWPPYMDQTRRDQGCVAKLINDAFAISNLKVRFIFMPWDRAYHQGLKQEFSGTAYWYYSEKRALDYIYTKTPVTSEISRFYHLDDLDFNYQTYKDLSHHTLLLNQGLTYPKKLLNAIKKHDITVVNATYTSKNLSLLLKKRADITVLTEQTKTEFAKALSAEQNQRIVFQEKPAFVSQGYLLINRHSQKYASLFDYGVNTLWKDQTYYDNYVKNCLNIK